MTSPRARSGWLLAVAALVLVAATVLMLRGVEPFFTFYYCLAWYATIGVADGWAGLRRPERPLLLGSARRAASLVLWSAVLWLFFELWNLRLANWYYVGVPHSLVARRVTLVLAFGTVLPALFAIDRLLATHGVAAGLRSRTLRLPPWVEPVLMAMGLVWAALVLVWPRLFFPLVWGVTVLLLAPLNRRLSRSGLLADLEAGRWTRIVRLLVAGLVCGILWEAFNIRAGSKWIYTVPGFEDWKLFEMPLAGFLGFPPFALECYVMYRWLVLRGVAVPWEPEPAARRASAGARGLALVVAAALLLAMPPLIDRHTTDSRRVRASDLVALVAAVGETPGDADGVGGADGAGGAGGADSALGTRLAAELARRGAVTPRELASAVADPAPWQALARETGGTDAATLAAWRDLARLALLRGLGTANARRLAALGIDSPAALAAADAAALAGRLGAPPARVRVWVDAARREQRAAR
ncbi:MAG: DUF4332 domain-containing protein [Candidatus Eiseniibacteriota bacterium]